MKVSHADGQQITKDHCVGEVVIGICSGKSGPNKNDQRNRVAPCSFTSVASHLLPAVPNNFQKFRA